MQQDTERGLGSPPLTLVVDRDLSLRALVREAFEQLSMATLGTPAGEEALEHLRDREVEVLVVGDGGPGISAADLAGHALRLEPVPLVILLVDEPKLAGARGQLEEGVFDIVETPVARPRLELLAARTRKQLDLHRELRTLRRQLQSREGFHHIVGRSRAMERVRRDVDRLGQGAACVWIHGESGTGKKLVARSLHDASTRSDQPFVVAQCAGLEGARDPWSQSFVEVGGVEPGLFERAAGGTLFLDGITELPHTAQESLVSALKQDHRPDLRLLVSASAGLQQSVASGVVLDELRAALAASELPLPTLAEHPEDLALLTRHFIATISEINHLPPMRLGPDALELLERHHWPGNVRELRNAVEHAVILSSDGVIRARDLPDHLRDAPAGLGASNLGAGISKRSFREAKHDVVGAFEEAYLSDLLRRHDGNVTSASLQAGMLRSALQRLLRKHDLKSADYRRSSGSGRRRAADDSARATEDA